MVNSESFDSTQVPNFSAISTQAHRVCRTQLNKKLGPIAKDFGIVGITRFFVPEAQISWDAEFPGYAPMRVDAPRGNSSFRKEGDNPHPDNPMDSSISDSLEVGGQVRRDQGYPLNPAGRTGMQGRGMLDKWGPTLAADLILTRQNPDDDAKLEVLLIERGDTGELALPGGKVDEGEEQDAFRTAAREIMEEANVTGIDLDPAQASLVFSGYVDDSRNTDNAWMETTAYRMHLNAEQARAVGVSAGSDAVGARWEEINEDLYPRLFASHGSYIRLAIEDGLSSNTTHQQAASPSMMPPGSPGKVKPGPSLDSSTTGKSADNNTYPRPSL